MTTSTGALAHAAFQAFAQTSEATGVLEQHYRIGPFTVTICCAGATVAETLLPSLDLLRNAGASGMQSEAHLTLYMFFTPLTGAGWTFPASKISGPRSYFEDENARIHFQSETQTLQILRKGENLGLLCTAGAFAGPAVSARIAQMIFHWWFGEQGFQLVHAAAVGTPQGGVLLAGKAGAGKSTTTAACIGSRLRIAGDDICLVSLHPVPFVYSLYNSIRLNPDVLPLLPLKTIQSEFRWDRNEAYFLLSKLAPEAAIAGFPLKAILAPKFAGSTETTLERVASPVALRSLAPSTVLQFSGDRSRSLRNLAALTQIVPGFLLHTGTRLSDIPPIILQALA